MEITGGFDLVFSFLVYIGLHTLQDSFGPDAFVACVHIYIDSAKVTTFGDHKYWPVFLWLGNVPKDMRNGKGLGRAILIGYLPTVRNLIFLLKLN